MATYHIFLTNPEGKEEMGGSHFDLARTCGIIETFIRVNKEREFVTISACREEEDGSITELARWNKGSTTPVFDIRDPEEMKQ
jgi:hypothetical protein